jgi:prophage regulatory protein
MTLDRYIRIKELAQMLGIAKSTIYRLIKLNQFPQQIKLSERTAVWKLSLINEWISQREKLGR